MRKKTTVKNRTRKYKKNRSRKHRGGGLAANLLKSNGVVMPDDITQRLFDNAVKVLERHPKYTFKIARILISIKQKCMNIADDDIEKFECGYKIASANFSVKDEKEIKTILVDFIKQNKRDIATLINKYDIKGVDSILEKPEGIYKLDRNWIDEIIGKNAEN